MEKAPLIYSKISAVMKEIGPLAKDRKNAQQGYNFRGIDELMNALSPAVAKHGIFPTCSNIQDVLSENIVSKNGGAGYRQIRRYTFTFFAEDGSNVSTSADGEAIDYGDKGSNKAYSVAYREAIFKLFVVPFENEDIEAVDHDLKPVARQAELQKVDGLIIKMAGLVSDLGHKGLKGDVFKAKVKELTDLECIEPNYADIIGRLELLREEANQK